MTNRRCNAASGKGKRNAKLRRRRVLSTRKERTMRYTWSFTELKKSEGGAGVADAVRAAKRTGATARRAESMFVGHELIVVETATKPEMRKALAAIKAVSSMVETVEDAMDNVEGAPSDNLLPRGE